MVSVCGGGVSAFEERGSSKTSAVAIKRKAIKSAKIAIYFFHTDFVFFIQDN